MSEVKLNTKSSKFKPFIINIYIDDSVSAKELWLTLCTDKDVIRAQHPDLENNFNYDFPTSLFQTLAGELKRQGCEPRMLPRATKRATELIYKTASTTKKHNKFNFFSRGKK